LHLTVEAFVKLTLFLERFDVHWEAIEIFVQRNTSWSDSVLMAKNACTLKLTADRYSCVVMKWRSMKRASKWRRAFGTCRRGVHGDGSVSRRGTSSAYNGR
jgi:hypothetical protein